MALAVDWINIADFSPGIFADLHGGIAAGSRGSVLTNGAATIDGTYRCCADPSGALVPLPAATTVQTAASIPDAVTYGTSGFPAAFPGAYVLDAQVIGPVGGSGTQPAELTYVNGEGSIDVYVMYAFFYDPGLTGTYRYMVMCRVWRGDGSIQDIMWESSYPVTITGGVLANYSILSGNLETVRTQANQTGAPPITVSRLYEAIAGVVRRNTAGRGSAAIPADERLLTTFETDVSGNYPDGTGATRPNGYVFVSPGPANQFTLTSFVLPSTETPQVVFGHQDRTVFCAKTPARQGNRWAVRDAIYYRAPLDVGGYVYPNGAFATQYGGENTATIGVVTSFSTDELLLVKHAGGGVLIKSDLANGTVVRMRSIASTYGVSSSGINTPIGFVYGGRTGVHLWTGGDTTQKLSLQIEGFFWRCGTEPYEGHRARFGWLDPWVVIPNNYLYDTRSKGWWRLADPADRSAIPYNVYQTDQTTGNLLAFPYRVDVNQKVIWDRFDPTILASSFSWRSQPLIETMDKLTTFQEIRIVASPGTNTNLCTVTVTLTGFDNNGLALSPSTSTFTFTGDGKGQPIIRHQVLHQPFNAMYAQVQVTASVTSGAAPKIHSVQLGTGTARSRSPIDQV
jgi:hypothetical protein